MASVIFLSRGIVNLSLYRCRFRKYVAVAARAPAHPTPRKPRGAHIPDDELLNLAIATEADDPLLLAVPAAPKDLRWTPSSKLEDMPLTGLARKVLLRLRVMQTPAPHIS